MNFDYAYEYLEIKVSILKSINDSNRQLLSNFIEISKDGYGIFDKDDRLIYANYALCDIFCISDEVDSPTFNDVVRQAYINKRGPLIDTEDIDTWLIYAASKRRKRPFRIFEVDLIDGRWFLFSEQLLPSGELLVQAKDMTGQKVVESQLQESVDKLGKLAVTDELTQLVNRRYFVKSVETELERYCREAASVTLLVIDLDHFKKVNDTYGHVTGDHALVHVANIFKQCIRQYDIAGRIGGEEFAIFLGNTELKIALDIADRIRLELQNTPLKEGQHVIHFSVSIGLACRTSCRSFEQLFNDADEALYQAKEKGRNRVETFAKTD